MNDPPSDPTTLPHTPLLTYLSGNVSPTRVKIIASRSVLIIAGIHLLLATLSLAAIVDDLWLPLTSGRLNARGLLAHLGDLISLEEPLPLLFAINFLLSGILAILSRHVFRGRRIAGIAAIITLIPITLVIAVTAFALSCIAVIDTFGLFHTPITWWASLWLALMALSILTLLLLKDLLAILIWIVRNPLMEKPSISFLPGTSP